MISRIVLQALFGVALFCLSLLLESFGYLFRFSAGVIMGGFPVLCVVRLYVWKTSHRDRMEVIAYIASSWEKHHRM